ncbi:MAG: carbon-nitrogen family hydrolase [Desulfobacteraceae bacterium]|nr:carbon-nitrogen family hydrolase [Desulfobacteraceae bacterium]
MKVASIQFSVVENNKNATLKKAKAAIEQCHDADLVILPEIWNIGFMSFDRYIKEAEKIDGPTITMLQGLAQHIDAYIHTGSFIEKENGHYYNTSLLLSPQGDILTTYRKIHLFGYKSRETELLTPGKSPVTVKTPLGIIGMATCFDLRFPELFRKMVDNGTQIFLVTSAWPHLRLEPWIMFNKVRALENQCFLISANSSGINNKVQFAGHSMLVDPWGSVIASAKDEETIVKSRIDLNKVQEARTTFPALAERKDFLKSK